MRVIDCINYSAAVFVGAATSSSSLGSVEKNPPTNDNNRFGFNCASATAAVQKFIAAFDHKYTGLTIVGTS